MIAMTKGVQSLMAKMESEFSVAIRQHIYAEMQDFVGGTLRELLAKAIKHKKDVLSGILMVIEGKRVINNTFKLKGNHRNLFGSICIRRPSIGQIQFPFIGIVLHFLIVQIQKREKGGRRNGRFNARFEDPEAKCRSK